MNDILATVGYESDKGVIIPCQMESWEPGEAPDYIITENIMMLGTNLIAPIIEAPPPVTYTITLSNNETITFSTYMMGPNTYMNYSFSSGPSSTNMLIYQGSTLIVDGLYVAIMPYTADVDAVTNWGIIVHDRLNNKWGYRWDIRNPASMKEQFRGTEEEEEPPEPQAVHKPDYDIWSDEVDFPSIPAINFLDTGMISVYECTTAQLQAFSSYLWTGNFFTDIVKIQNNPMEAVISLHILPINATSSASTIHIGSVDSQVSAGRVTGQYYYLDFGTVSIGNYRGTFYDWNPYTKAEIFLPYIGVRQIDIDEAMGSSLHLKYLVDIVSGNCTAMLKVKRITAYNGQENLNTLLYHWNGSMLTPGLLTARDFTEQIKANIGTIATAAIAVGASVATGGASAGVTAAAFGAVGASGVKAATTPAPVQHSGTLGGNHGFLGCQKAYVILSRPTLSVPENLAHESGIAINRTYTIGSLTGYTEMDEVHLEGFPAPQEIKDEIESVLKSGFIA